MVTTLTQFSDFIDDFELTNLQPAVCFNALISFNWLNQNLCFESIVLMEAFCSSAINSVHLLNPVIAQYNLPVFFNEANNRFLHIHNSGLLISGNIPLSGPFTITVFPKINLVGRSLAAINNRKLN